MKKYKYQLKVQIGKKAIKGKVFKFNTNDPVKSLLSINVPKLVEAATITLETEGKKATLPVRANRARLAFNNKLNAFFVIKVMRWLLK